MNTENLTKKEIHLINNTIEECKKVILNTDAKEFFTMPLPRDIYDRGEQLYFLRKQLAKECEKLKVIGHHTVECTLTELRPIATDNLPLFAVTFQNTLDCSLLHFIIGVKELELIRQVADNTSIWDANYCVTYETQPPQQIISISWGAPDVTQRS